MANGEKAEYKDFNIGDSTYRQRGGEVFKLDGSKYDRNVSDQIKTQIENYGRPQETVQNTDPLKNKISSDSSPDDSTLSGSSVIANGLTEPNMGKSDSGNDTQDQSSTGQNKEESVKPETEAQVNNKSYDQEVAEPGPFKMPSPPGEENKPQTNTPEPEKNKLASVERSTPNPERSSFTEASYSRTPSEANPLKTSPAEDAKTMPDPPAEKPNLERMDTETLRLDSPAPFLAPKEVGVSENHESSTLKSEEGPSTYKSGYIDEPFRGESLEAISQNNDENMTHLEGQEIRDKFDNVFSDSNLAKLKMAAEFERMGESVSQTLNNGANTWASALSGTNLFGSQQQPSTEGNSEADKSFQDLYSARENIDSDPEVRFHNAAQDLYTQAANNAQAEIQSKAENGEPLTEAQKQEIEADHFKSAFETVIKESMKVESKANEKLANEDKKTQEEQIKAAVTRATDTLAKHMVFSSRELGPISMINEKMIMTNAAKEKALENAETPEQKEAILKQTQDLAYLSDAYTKHAEIDPKTGDYKDARELYNGMTKLSAANAVRELYDEARNAGLTDPAEVKNYVENKMADKINEEMKAFNDPNDSRYIKSEKMKDYFLAPRGENYAQAGRYEAYMKIAAKSYEEVQAANSPQEFEAILKDEKAAYGEYLGMINEAGTMLDSFTVSGDGLAHFTRFR